LRTQGKASRLDCLFLDDSLTPQLVACLFVHARLHLEAVLPDFGASIDGSTWNVLQSCDVSYWRSVFIFKFARTSIGARNEHLLHNRRRGRGTRDCWPPRTACLNKRAMMAVPLFDRLVLNRAPARPSTEGASDWPVTRCSAQNCFGFRGSRENATLRIGA
jgi:hypothetical protein